MKNRVTANAHVVLLAYNKISTNTSSPCFVHQSSVGTVKAGEGSGLERWPDLTETRGDSSIHGPGEA